MSIFSEYKFKRAVIRLAERKLLKFLVDSDRGPFTNEEQLALFNRVFIPYFAVKVLRRLALRGHEVENTITPEQLRGFGV